MDDSRSVQGVAQFALWPNIRYLAYFCTYWSENLAKNPLVLETIVSDHFRRSWTKIQF